MLSDGVSIWLHPNLYIMKHTIIEYIKPVIRDSHALALMIAIVILTLILVIVAMINIHPTELQIVTHYSGFGVTNFYRDKWYYLINFIVFGVLLAVSHIAIGCKLYTEKSRSMSIGFLWLSVAVVLLTIFVMAALMNVANLI